jgi:uncharacterized protein YcbK (DUF882 family)
MNIGRRELLRLGGAAAIGSVATPALADLGLSDVRSLNFNNIHTGEQLAISYWENGAYVPDALSEINHFLRDYRNNEVHIIEPKLLDLLTVLHAKLESSVPFQVISGYRSPQTNAMLRSEYAGVAKHSLHMKGMAMDLRLADRNLADVHRVAVGLRLGGVGYYPDADFVHCDVGRVRYWSARG